jgi:hypothetical protein
VKQIPSILKDPGGHVYQPVLDRLQHRCMQLEARSQFFYEPCSRARHAEPVRPRCHSGGAGAASLRLAEMALPLSKWKEMREPRRMRFVHDGDIVFRGPRKRESVDDTFVRGLYVLLA